MSDFILQLALFLSLGTAILVIAKAVPRLGEEGSESPKKISVFFSNLPIHKYDARLASFTEKNLRKLRVLLLKVDNGVMAYINKVRATTKSNGGNGLKDLLEEQNGNGQSGTLV